MEFTNWHKSSKSGNQGNCVEVGHSTDGHTVGVRDSKDPSPVISLTRLQWLRFLEGVKAGDFDL